MSVASQNPFSLLGNNVDDDTPVVPLKTVEKTSTHTSKRNTDGLAPSKGPVSTGNRRGGAYVSGNEAAFRDRQAGRESNRGKPTDEGPRGGRRGGFRGRGGRREEGDRHPTKTYPHSNSEKQAAQSWGANEGDAELKDEQAGEDIAQSEQKEAAAEGEAAPEAEAKEEEPEEKHMTLDQFLAKQAEKKLALEAEKKDLRKPNEGVKEDKWKGYAPLKKDEEEDELFTGTAGKSERKREKKTKQYVEIENRYIEPERPRGGRGGRGGARGDGGRGRGRGAPRGDFRGGRGRGSQEKESQPINTNDEEAFPSLGGKTN
ncbi:hypothetical protein VTK56DRAFT_5157 [Thermocarpiscus australiensis]